MIVYIDREYKCHVSNDGTMTPVDTDFFDGKCEAFIEGYRFVPEGCTWTRSDGEVFRGEMVCPWKPYHELDAEQRRYERDNFASVKRENEELLADLGDMVNIVYESDLEVINNV